MQVWCTSHILVLLFVGGAATHPAGNAALFSLLTCNAKPTENLPNQVEESQAHPLEYGKRHVVASENLSNLFRADERPKRWNLFGRK